MPGAPLDRLATPGHDSVLALARYERLPSRSPRVTWIRLPPERTVERLDIGEADVRGMPGDVIGDREAEALLEVPERHLELGPIVGLVLVEAHRRQRALLRPGARRVPRVLAPDAQVIQETCLGLRAAQRLELLELSPPRRPAGRRRPG